MSFTDPHGGLKVPRFFALERLQYSKCLQMQSHPIHGTLWIGGVSQIGILVLFPGILGYCLSKIGILGYSKPNLGYWDIALMSISGQILLGIQVSLTRFGIWALQNWDMGPHDIGIFGTPLIHPYGRAI